MTNETKNCDFCGRNEHEEGVKEVIVSHEFGGCICRDCVFMSLSYLYEMESMVDAIMEGLRK